MFFIILIIKRPIFIIFNFNKNFCDDVIRKKKLFVIMKNDIWIYRLNKGFKIYKAYKKKYKHFLIPFLFMFSFDEFIPYKAVIWAFFEAFL